MEHPNNFPTAAEYAQAAADKAAEDVKQALERLERIEMALAGDPAARAAMLEATQDRIAANARPRPPAPSFADFLKQAYSPESIALTNDSVDRALGLK